LPTCVCTVNRRTHRSRRPDAADVVRRQRSSSVCQLLPLLLLLSLSPVLSSVDGDPSAAHLRRGNDLLQTSVIRRQDRKTMQITRIFPSPSSGVHMTAYLLKISNATPSRRQLARCCFWSSAFVCNFVARFDACLLERSPGNS